MLLDDYHCILCFYILLVVSLSRSLEDFFRYYLWFEYLVAQNLVFFGCLGAYAAFLLWYFSFHPNKCKRQHKIIILALSVIFLERLFMSLVRI